MGVGSVVLWIVALWPLPTRCLQLIPAPLNCEKQKYWRTWLCPQGGGIKNHWVRSTVWEINLKALCKKDWKFLCYRQRPVNQRPQMLWHIQQYAKQPPTTKKWSGQKCSYFQDWGNCHWGKHHIFILCIVSKMNLDDWKITPAEWILLP